MKSPLISIIIPTYNPGNYLRPALNSIVAQTYRDWEIIIVDDGSKPEQLSSIKNLVSELRNAGVPVNLVTQENCGVSVARNRGIELAKGEYLAFLDNDDVWEPTKLEQQIKAFEDAPHAALCHTDFDLIDENGNKSGDGYGAPGDYETMLRGRFGVLLSSSMVRRSCWGECGYFDPCYRYAQDLDVFMMLARTYPFVYVASVLTHYRLHSTNASSNYWNTYQEICHAMEKHRLMAIEAHNPKLIQCIEEGRKNIAPTFSNQAFQCFRAKMKSGKTREGLIDLKRAFMISPKLIAREILATTKELVMNPFR